MSQITAISSLKEKKNAEKMLLAVQYLTGAVWSYTDLFFFFNEIQSQDSDFA